MNKAQLARMIRFHLGEMRTQNAQHEFEHLSRSLARAKVHSNLLPSTGPVGAGGDQGRDFETYRSSIDPAAKAVPDRRSSGSRKVVFACTLQSKIVSKVKSDVNAIMVDESVDEVIYFCEANLPVAKRHELIQWAQKTHGVELQLFDGAAIAEMLAEPDVFWIAEEYLHLPADIFPRPDDETGWYASHYERWRSRDPVPLSVSDYFEVKAGLRHATFEKEGRPHLLRWLTLMETFRTSPAPRQTNRAAAYEIAVATLRGKDDLTPAKELVRDYFSDVEEWLSPADLQDAATLVTYAFGGAALGHFDCELTEILGWRRRVADILEREIAEAPGPGRRSALLRIRGHLACVPNDLETPPDVEGGFDDWEKALDAAEEAPLFPIEEFGEHLGKIAPYLGDHPRFTPLIDRVEELIAKKAGPAAAAELAFDRALESYASDDLLSAIRDLHRIQQRWFTGDRLEDFQRATLLLSQCYLELGLAYAAKYVALVGAHLALHDDRPEVKVRLPQMLLQVADADLGAGNSLAYTDMLGNAIGAHAAFAPDPLDRDRYPEIWEQLGQLSALRGTAARYDERHLKLLDDRLQRWDERLREIVIQSSEDPSGFWRKGTEDEYWRELEEAFISRPFGDAGSTRATEWRALGVGWSVSFANEPVIAAAAEEIIAQLQIAQAALAGSDLVLIPTDIRIELLFSDEQQEPSVEARRAGFGERGISCVVRMPLKESDSDDDPRKRVGPIVELVAEICRALSALPDEVLVQRLGETAEAVMTRVFMGRPYRELYAEILALDRKLPSSDDLGPLAQERPFATREHPLLAASSQPAWNYDEDRAVQAVRERYERAPKSIRHSLARLIATPEKRVILEGWHQEGLLDWEILSIVANAAMNIRAPLGEDPIPQQIEQMRALFDRNESTEDALSPEQFTEDLLRISRKTFLYAFADGWGLRPHLARTDEIATERLLIQRYGLRSTDVEHDDLFRWDGTSAQD